MKPYFYILFTVFINCSDNISENDIQKLNGYWEINKVESIDEKVTEFKINSTIDFYYVDKTNQGYRKKTSIDFSGTYKTNKIKDQIIIENKNGQYIIKTKTPFDNWEDTIIKLTNESLTLKNKSGAMFYYKKHEKFNSN